MSHMPRVCSLLFACAVAAVACDDDDDVDWGAGLRPADAAAADVLAADLRPGDVLDGGAEAAPADTGPADAQSDRAGNDSTGEVAPDALGDMGSETGAEVAPDADTGTDAREVGPEAGSDATDALNAIAGVTDLGLCQLSCALAAMSACAPVPGECLSECQAELAGSCGTHARAVHACLVRLTAADFSCSSRGRRTLAPGLCVTEMQAQVGCVLAPR